VLKGWPQKLMLSRYSVLVRSGHHQTMLEPDTPPPLGERREYRVGHFKWHGGLVERMRWGLKQPNASAPWKGETRRLLNWLDRHGGKIDLSDPKLQARRAAGAAW
jgi:hypothetical protein